MRLGLKVNDLRLVKGYKLLISGLNFEITAGEALSLYGENGVGKTTLLRTLAGFTVPDGGHIAFVANHSQIEPEEARTGHVHFLGHHDALSPARTVAEELAFQASYLGGEASAAVEPLRLKPLMDLETRHLSAGQKRRLSCARLLMAPRSLWLLDEPMAPLDVEHRTLLGGLMQAHLADGGMIVAAVHDALPFATRTLRLERPEVQVG